MTVNERIASLRAQMSHYKIDAYIVPSSDPHQSEYVAEHWQSRAWISGFTGSAGTAVVLKDEAALWTDSRYFLQAETELASSEMELHKQGVPHAPEHISWLSQILPKGATVGLDGKLFSIGQVASIRTRLGAKGIAVNANLDLIEPIWNNRPSLPMSPIFEYEVKFAGKSRVEKLTEVRHAMQHDFYLISTLDDIAWLLNLRGSDVDCNPVFYAYALVGKNEVILFVNPSKVPHELVAILEHDAIKLLPYTQITTKLQSLQGTISIDKASTSAQIYESIAKEQIQTGENIVLQHKAIKNATEVMHIKNAMKKDGVALTKLFMWLEQTLEERTVPEVEVAERLANFRKEQGDYFGESFSAIVGYQGNGAIVHYRPEAATCANLEKKGILLLDSGGQYFDGTTDITRTVALGTPTEEQKRNFTLVLKGHIALDRAKFPQGTTGPQLDTLARMHLWQDGLNYGHGTGHGVGFFLNVHEPPQGFATNPTTSRGRTAIEPGMFTSNEPGFYKDGEYGIRIENLVLCVEGEKTPYGQFYQFENLTLFPIDVHLIDKNLLTKEEVDWLNAYHAKVNALVSPLLTDAEKAWMAAKCQAI